MLRENMRLCLGRMGVHKGSAGCLLMSPEDTVKEKMLLFFSTDMCSNRFSTEIYSNLFSTEIYFNLFSTEIYSTTRFQYIFQASWHPLCARGMACGGCATKHRRTARLILADDVGVSFAKGVLIRQPHYKLLKNHQKRKSTLPC